MTFANHIKGKCLKVANEYGQQYQLDTINAIYVG